jgi:hypothetical protein
MVYTSVIMPEMLLHYGPLSLKNLEHVNLYLKLYFQLKSLSFTCPFIFFHSLDPADSHAAKRLHGVSQITFLL